MSSLSDKEYYQLVSFIKFDYLENTPSYLKSSKSQTISVGKALNSYEMPVKSKHLRTCIIATYHSNGGHPFWAIAIRQPLQENRITAWKFCHVLHKLLREGHPLVPQHSMRHRGMISELGKLWVSGLNNCGTAE
jgi:huntingtin interacting protein 1